MINLDDSSHDADDPDTAIDTARVGPLLGSDSDDDIVELERNIYEFDGVQWVDDADGITQLTQLTQRVSTTQRECLSQNTRLFEDIFEVEFPELVFEDPLGYHSDGHHQDQNDDEIDDDATQSDFWIDDDDTPKFINRVCHVEEYEEADHVLEYLLSLDSESESEPDTRQSNT